MSTTLSFSQTDPVSIPNNSSNDDDEQAYKDMIKQLAAQAPEPYGAIPPLTRRKDKDKSKRKKIKKKKKSSKDKKTPIRRMSHVENWLAVDSKESIPDEEDLKHSSPFRNFLSTDFLVLPLHMPPPSLSATVPDEELARPAPLPSASAAKTADKDLRPVLFPIKQPPIQVIPITDSRLIDDDDDDDEEEDGEEDEEDGEEDEEDEEEEEGEEDTTDKILDRKRSIPSFSKSQQPSTSMTKSYAMSTSPPSSSAATMSTSASSTSSTEQEPSKNRWLETIAQLRRSLTLSNSRQQQQQQPSQDSSDTNPPTPTRKSNFIPMPLPPKRNIRKKRRSEATTQPRFNPETNTYTRDTRSNPDHLRMISAELNMMRHRKLSSPLKPRGFLPRRTDAFIRGQQRKLSALKYEL